jgi:hypothetical protein
MIENIAGDVDTEEKTYEKIELKDGKKEELKKVFDLFPDIESKYFSSALEYVRQDAEDIIFYIKNLLKEREEHLRKQKLALKQKRIKR